MPTINSSKQPVPDQISQHWCSGGIFLSQVQEHRISPNLGSPYLADVELCRHKYYYVS